MNRKYLLILLFCISCSIHTIAQTDYYYYQGRKIPLTLNENKVCLSIPNDCDKTSTRIRANVQVLNTVKDETFDIVVITRADFEKLSSLEFWEEDAKSVILTSSYLTEDNHEVVASPYLNVRLLNEGDTDVLTSYVEQYKLRIVGKSAFMPWYILSVTQDSEKSPLECANELYESGNFAASVPDLVSLTREMDEMAQGQEPIPPFYLDENDHYVYYTGTDAGRQFMSELVYTLRETEEIGNHLYYIVYDRLSIRGEKKTNSIHMRESNGRLLVRLDEYIWFMQESRGRDMSDFYDKCQYEVTDEGEMVLYDFNMQVGDKFRSVEGKEDIVVTKTATYTKSTSEGRVTRNLIYLSNGSYLLDQIGYAGDVNSQSTGYRLTGDYFDYLNTGSQNLNLWIAQEGTKCLYGNGGGKYDPDIMGIRSVSEDNTGSQKIHDLSGREISSPSSSGIYIRAGKKYAAR